MDIAYYPMPMDVTVDFLTQIPRLLRELTKLVQEPLDRQRGRRTDFFKREIDPTHVDMQSINNDYMRGFSELIALLGSEADPERIIELLRQKRLVMLTTRSERLATAKALADARKTAYIRKREIASFVAYSEAIRTYLKDASPGDARFTWYGAFIDEFERLAKSGEFPSGEFASIIASKPPVDLIRNAFTQAVQTDSPRAWENYAAAYSQLRLELNR
jgi:hypothetical protein